MSLGKSAAKAGDTAATKSIRASIIVIILFFVFIVTPPYSSQMRYEAANAVYMIVYKQRLTVDSIKAYVLQSVYVLLN